MHTSDSAGALHSTSARTSAARTARLTKTELVKAATLAVAAADDATGAEILRDTMTRVAEVNAAAKSSITHLDESQPTCPLQVYGCKSIVLDGS